MKLELQRSLDKSPSLSEKYRLNALNMTDVANNVNKAAGDLLFDSSLVKEELFLSSDCISICAVAFSEPSTSHDASLSHWWASALDLGDILKVMKFKWSSDRYNVSIRIFDLSV